MSLLLYCFAALFSIINPLGTLPMFIGLTEQKTPVEIRKTALWSSINTMIILVISFFTGKLLLTFFGIQLTSLKIAGGIIIAASGFSLLTGSFTKHKGMKKREKDDAQSRSDIALTPIAIPMLAGPGSITLLITYHEEYPKFLDQLTILSAILMVCSITFGLLLASKVIVKTLGASGVNALSRIIGFVVIAIGVEYIVSAALELFKGLT